MVKLKMRKCFCVLSGKKKTKSLLKVSFQPVEINSYLGLDLTVSSFFVGYLQTERNHDMLETKPHYMS